MRQRGFARRTTVRCAVVAGRMRTVAPSISACAIANGTTLRSRRYSSVYECDARWDERQAQQHIAAEAFPLEADEIEQADPLAASEPPQERQAAGVDRRRVHRQPCSASCQGVGDARRAKTAALPAPARAAPGSGGRREALTI